MIVHHVDVVGLYAIPRLRSLDFSARDILGQTPLITTGLLRYPASCSMYATRGNVNIADNDGTCLIETLNFLNAEFICRVDPFASSLLLFREHGTFSRNSVNVDQIGREPKRRCKEGYLRFSFMRSINASIPQTTRLCIFCLIRISTKWK